MFFQELNALGIDIMPIGEEAITSDGFPCMHLFYQGLKVREQKGLATGKGEMKRPP